MADSEPPATLSPMEPAAPRPWSLRKRAPSSQSGPRRGAGVAFRRRRAGDATCNGTGGQSQGHDQREAPGSAWQLTSPQLKNRPNAALVDSLRTLGPGGTRALGSGAAETPPHNVPTGPGQGACKKGEEALPSRACPLSVPELGARQLPPSSARNVDEWEERLAQGRYAAAFLTPLTASRPPPAAMFAGVLGPPVGVGDGRVFAVGSTMFGLPGCTLQPVHGATGRLEKSMDRHYPLVNPLRPSTGAYISNHYRLLVDKSSVR
eukprot:scaffold604_cov384-Prasinococcus_capsulatus_cf.AAC.28